MASWMSLLVYLLSSNTKSVSLMLGALLLFKVMDAFVSSSHLNRHILQLDSSKRRFGFVFGGTTNQKLLPMYNRSNPWKGCQLLK